MTLEQMLERAKSLKPEVGWIPRSEQEYLQRQKLLPVFKGWLNQIWEAQQPHIKSLIAEVWNEAIKECEESWKKPMNDQVRRKKEHGEAMYEKGKRD